MLTLTNLLTDVPSNLPDELFQTLIHRSGLHIERIVSHGHRSPEGFWFDQDRHEFVVLLQGSARLRVGETLIEMQPGSFLNIPAHQRHRVEWTDSQQPTIWLAVHYDDATSG